LMDRVRDALLRDLRGRGFNADDCDDLVQETSKRVWGARTMFEPRGPGGWWVFVQRTAFRCAVDQARLRGRFPEGPEPEDVPDTDMPYLDVLVSLAEDRDRLYETADACWLGLPRDAKENRLRLLAVQMHLLHGMAWQDIAKILKIEDVHEENALDRWSADPKVLRHVGYTSLYGSNDSLTAFLLGKKQTHSSELDALLRAAEGKRDVPCPENWTWSEVSVVIWRHRYGFTAEKIALIPKNEFNRYQLESIFERCQKLYPFARIATRLNRSYQAIGQGEVLQQTGVWRRIVFQYACADELPHKQILDRAAPAADVFDVKMTAVTLNGWLSMGRLFAQLVSFFQKENPNA
jgi:DNA-directed RNA polymerase specialized sigma24 family protein